MAGPLGWRRAYSAFWTVSLLAPIRRGGKLRLRDGGGLPVVAGFDGVVDARAGLAVDRGPGWYYSKAVESACVFSFEESRL